MQCYKNPILSVLLKQEYDHNNQVENSLHKHRCYDNSNTFLCACRTLVQFREKMCRVETRRISSVQLICRMCSHCIRLRSCCIQCFIYIFQAKKKLWNSVENSTKENVPKMKPILQTKWESLEFQLGILIQLHTQSAQFCPLYPLFSIPNSDILPDQFPSFLWYYIIFFWLSTSNAIHPGDIFVFPSSSLYSIIFYAISFFSHAHTIFCNYKVEVEKKMQILPSLYSLSTSLKTHNRTGSQ